MLKWRHLLPRRLDGGAPEEVGEAEEQRLGLPLRAARKVVGQPPISGVG